MVPDVAAEITAPLAKTQRGMVGVGLLVPTALLTGMEVQSHSEVWNQKADRRKGTALALVTYLCGIIRITPKKVRRVILEHYRSVSNQQPPFQAFEVADDGPALFIDGNDERVFVPGRRNATRQRPDTGISR